MLGSDSYKRRLGFLSECTERTEKTESNLISKYFSKIFYQWPSFSSDIENLYSPCDSAVFSYHQLRGLSSLHLLEIFEYWGKIEVTRHPIYGKAFALRKFLEIQCKLLILLAYIFRGFNDFDSVAYTCLSVV